MSLWVDLVLGVSLWVVWGSGLVYNGIMRSARTVQLSMRFSVEEVELLDAARAVMEHSTGLRLGRADVVRRYLMKIPPSIEVGPLHSTHRDAYKKVFDS